jgi:hypothetical protein
VKSLEQMIHDNIHLFLLTFGACFIFNLLYVLGGTIFMIAKYGKGLRNFPTIGYARYQKYILTGVPQRWQWADQFHYSCPTCEAAWPGSSLPPSSVLGRCRKCRGLFFHNVMSFPRDWVGLLVILEALVGVYAGINVERSFGENLVLIMAGVLLGCFISLIGFLPIGLIGLTSQGMTALAVRFAWWGKANGA